MSDHDSAGSLGRTTRVLIGGLVGGAVLGSGIAALPAAAAPGGYPPIGGSDAAPATSTAPRYFDGQFKDAFAPGAVDSSGTGYLRIVIGEDPPGLPTPPIEMVAESTDR